MPLSLLALVVSVVTRLHGYTGDENLRALSAFGLEVEFQYLPHRDSLAGWVELGFVYHRPERSAA